MVQKVRFSFILPWVKLFHILQITDCSRKLLIFLKDIWTIRPDCGNDRLVIRGKAKTNFCTYRKKMCKNCLILLQIKLITSSWIEHRLFPSVYSFLQTDETGCKSDCENDCAFMRECSRQVNRNPDGRFVAMTLRYRINKSFRSLALSEPCAIINSSRPRRNFTVKHTTDYHLRPTGAEILSSRRHTPLPVEASSIWSINSNTNQAHIDACPDD